MREQQNSTERIRILALDSVSAGVTGATVLLSIRRDADGQYWNGSSFGASFNTVAMTETDATNRAGEYHYDFDTTGLADAAYSFRATTASSTVVNDPWIGELKIGGFVDNIDAAISTRSSHSAADVWAAATRTLTASLDPTAAAIADAVCDEFVAGHLVFGSVGHYLNTIKKYVANKLEISGTTYTLYEDDASTPYETGTSTTTERTPS